MNSIEKSIQDGLREQRERIEKSYTHENDIEKASKANIGDIHNWSGKLFKKVGDGEWKPMRDSDIGKDIDNFNDIFRINNWVRQNFNIKNESNISLASIKVVFKAICPLKAKYYIIGDQYWIIDGKDTNIPASASPNSLMLNKYDFNNLSGLESRISFYIKNYYHPKVKNKIKALLYHEFAHSLTVYPIKNKIGSYYELKAIYDEYLSDVANSGNIYDNEVPDNPSFEEAKNLIEKMEEVIRNNVNFVSEDAEKNLDEFVAECFSMTSDSDCKNTFVLKVKSVIDKFYKK